MSGLKANRVVVPVDFSDISFDAVNRAMKIVGDEGRVDVVHVLPILATMEYGSLYGTATDETRIDHVKSSLRKRFPDSKHPVVKVHTAIGDPGHEITELAKHVTADMIVMPSHGYGFVKHMLLGSVAERVIRFAHCPVLVLRGASPQVRND